MADLAETGMTRHDIRPFGLQRLLEDSRPSPRETLYNGRSTRSRGFRRVGEVGTFW